MLCHDLRVCYKTSPGSSSMQNCFDSDNRKETNWTLHIHKLPTADLKSLMDMRNAGVNFIYVHKEKQGQRFITLLWFWQKIASKKGSLPFQNLEFIQISYEKSKASTFACHLLCVSGEECQLYSDLWALKRNYHWREMCILSYVHPLIPFLLELWHPLSPGNSV